MPLSRDVHQDGHETGSEQIQTGITLQGGVGQARAHVLMHHSRFQMHVLHEDVTPDGWLVRQEGRQLGSQRGAQAGR